MKENLAFYKKSGDDTWTKEEYLNILDFVGETCEEIDIHDEYSGKWIYYVAGGGGYYNWGDIHFESHGHEYTRMAYEDIPSIQESVNNMLMTTLQDIPVGSVISVGKETLEKDQYPNFVFDKEEYELVTVYRDESYTHCIDKDCYKEIVLSNDLVYLKDFQVIDDEKFIKNWKKYVKQYFWNLIHDGFEENKKVILEIDSIYDFIMTNGD